MSNRFTDSEKFKDKWYRNLSPKHKCMWEYFLSECNVAGILEMDLPMMSFCIGEKIEISDFKEFENKIIFIKEDLIYIPNFILFQQKINSLDELNPRNNAHKGILSILAKHNIDSNFKAPFMPLVRGIGKGIGKGIGNIKEKELKKLGEFQNVLLSDEAIIKVKELYKDRFEDAIETLSNYLQSKGDKYKDHYAVLRKNNWVYEKVFSKSINKQNEDNNDEFNYV